MTVRVCTVGRMELAVHPLAVLVLFGACVLGRLYDLLQAMLALTMHEAAHVVVSNAFGCRILSVEIQPFGGVARMQQTDLAPRAERCIASAGPVASFIIAGVTAIVCDYAPMAGARMHAFLTFNLTLGLLNLLPALPLDGGRVARSFLQERFGAAAALRVTGWMGVITALGMLGLTALAAIRGVYNLTLPVMGLFLLLAAATELKTVPERQIAAFWHKNDVLSAGGGMDVHLLAAHSSMRAAEALRLMQSNRFNLIRVMDARMRLAGELDEGALVLGMARLGVQASVGDILTFDRKQRI